MLRFITTIMLSAFFMMSCSQQHLKSGIDKSNFDTSVKPQQDFFTYVNGNWIKKTKIPADRASYGSFTQLFEESQKNLRKIIEEAAQTPNKKEGSDLQKIGDFYTSFMDTVQIEEKGLKPLQAELARVNAIKSRKDLVKELAHLHRIGVQTPFGYFVNQDAKNSTQYISYLSQSGLGLPDRDFYLKDNPKFRQIRAKYREYVGKLLSLAGHKMSEKEAQKLFRIEKTIAENHWTRVQNRDRDKTYNKYSIAKLKKLLPNLDWDLYAQEAGITRAKEVIVRQPDYFKALNKMLRSYPLNDWKLYLTVKLLNDAAPYLSSDFVNVNFDFYGRTLRGTPQNRPRWKRAVNATNGVLGQVLGRIYVKKYFKPEAKQRMVELVNNLKLAFKDRIEHLQWMGPETKKAALEKLSKFHTKIGYPDKWKDYSKLAIKKDDLLGNLQRASEFEYQRMIDKLGKPIDRTEWFMNPQTVNAYYNPSMNEIVFPAAILQPPFFDMSADDAVNYGGIGAVIGHEISHGFDDQGRKSDGDGNLRDWWTAKDKEEFQKRARKMVEEYNAFMPVDSLHVNGKLTLGENIGDLGGVTVAYHAYKLSLKGKKAPVIDGLTGDQRFFMGWAQVWRRKSRPEETRRRLLTDPHSPGKYRVIGILSNLPEFYRAFDVHKGDPMWRSPDKRVQIW